jgi:hypothetical protein
MRAISHHSAGAELQELCDGHQTITGYEVTAMIRKGQVTSASANDMDAQRDFIAGLFSTAG